MAILPVLPLAGSIGSISSTNRSRCIPAHRKTLSRELYKEESTMAWHTVEDDIDLHGQCLRVIVLNC